MLQEIVKISTLRCQSITRKRFSFPSARFCFAQWSVKIRPELTRRRAPAARERGGRRGMERDPSLLRALRSRHHGQGRIRRGGLPRGAPGARANPSESAAAGPAAAAVCGQGESGVTRGRHIFFAR